MVGAANFWWSVWKGLIGIAKLALSLLIGGMFSGCWLGSECRAQQPVTADEMLPVQRRAAGDYLLHPAGAPDDALRLNEQPLFVWSNPRRAGGQVGHLFVWMRGEHPGAVGTIFSFPWQGNHHTQRLVHELHSLLETKLVAVNEEAVREWTPTGGIEFIEVPGSAAVPDSPRRRRLIMRQLSRRFRAHTRDADGQHWSLTLLPKELFRYESDRRVGALYGMLGDAGADPELLLLVEAAESGGAWRWRFSPVRMTDHEIFLSFAGDDIWSSVHDAANTRFRDAKHNYFRFQDKLHQVTR